MSEYTCAICGETFEEGWSREEALAETKRLFGAVPPPKELEIICDDCHQAYLKWFKRKFGFDLEEAQTRGVNLRELLS